LTRSLDHLYLGYVSRIWVGIDTLHYKAQVKLKGIGCLTRWSDCIKFNDERF